MPCFTVELISAMFLTKTGIPFAVTPKPYSEYSDKQLRVRLDAKKGCISEDFKKIQDIIDEAKVES
jgi:hypothetical protein